MAKRRIIIPEEQLVFMLQKREERAFTILYDNYSAALYGIVHKIVKADELASDVMQDAFLKIWRNVESYTPQKGTLFTWMLNIARNTAIDKLRSQDYQQSQQNQSLDISVGIVEQQNERFDNQVDYIGLRKLVEQLRPEYRQLIELVYLQGYTQAEVSDEYNIPLGTVKTRIKAALGQLRTLMGPALWAMFVSTYFYNLSR